MYTVTQLDSSNLRKTVLQRNAEYRKASEPLFVFNISATAMSPVHQFAVHKSSSAVELVAFFERAFRLTPRKCAELERKLFGAFDVAAKAKTSSPQFHFDVGTDSSVRINIESLTKRAYRVKRQQQTSTNVNYLNITIRGLYDLDYDLKIDPGIPLSFYARVVCDKMRFDIQNLRMVYNNLPVILSSTPRDLNLVNKSVIHIFDLANEESAYHSFLRSYHPQIVINVRDVKSNSITSIKIDRYMPLAVSIANAIPPLRDVDTTLVKLTYNGRDINSNSTPLDLSIQSNDVVDISYQAD